MTATIRQRGPAAGGPVLVLAGAALACVALLAWLGILGWGPLRGHHDAGSAPIVVVAVLATTGLSAVVGIGLWVGRAHGARGHVDVAARLLATPRELRRSTTDGVRTVAASVGYGHVGSPGAYIGRSVWGGRDLWGSWEEVQVDISGPRTGKTSTRVIPNVVAAPGAVLVTSCKRDVVDATRDVRARRGRVWVFDPQNVVGERPTWFWDPLAMVAKTMKEAISVAGLIAFTQRQKHERSDGYFGPAAENLLGMLLLAASVSEQPITVVRTWLLRPADTEPEDILRGAGHLLGADTLATTAGLPGAQRAGIYGMALQLVSWLAAPEILPWITPGEGREEFRFEAFSQSTDSLYILSNLDDRIAAPAVTTLNAAVIVAAEYFAAQCPGGRLPVPFLAVMDEAANVAPLPILPNRLSHYGSRGVVVLVMLQSWAQGVGAWGETGMAKIWNASAVRIYGGGGSEQAFLHAQSLFTGTFEARTASTTGRFGDWLMTRTRASRSESILDPADLAGLPRGRMLVQIGGARPVLVRSVPWWEGPSAKAIAASIARHAPRHQ